MTTQNKPALIRNIITINSEVRLLCQEFLELSDAITTPFLSYYGLYIHIFVIMPDSTVEVSLTSWHGTVPVTGVQQSPVHSTSWHGSIPVAGVQQSPVPLTSWNVGGIQRSRRGGHAFLPSCTH